MMKNNIYEYDKLSLLVKKNKRDEIVNYYKLFGWSLESEEENSRYEDLLDLTFSRPHKIENKDELQLQQVYLEETINEIAKLERQKHAKTTGLGLFFGGIGLTLSTIGILLILNVLTFFNLAGGIVLLTLGVMFMIGELILLPRVFKKEKIVFEKHHSALNEQLNEICETAGCLTGGEHEQD